MEDLGPTSDMSAYAVYVSGIWPSEESCLAYERLAGRERGGITVSNINDPIGDMLTRIRNAISAKHQSLTMPLSKPKLAIAQILKAKGYIKHFDVIKDAHQGTLKIYLSYLNGKESPLKGLKRVSKPGLKIYVGKGEIPRIYGGMGTAIMSTSRGMVTGQEAWKLNIGGELLCYVW